MSQAKSYISLGDFVDLFYKIKEKGYYKLLSKFRLSQQGRTVSKWNNITESSDFWIIPQIRERWNEKCTGNAKLEYEDYFVKKYLVDATNLRMLSIGCGAGSRERKFAKYSNFESIEGLDIAPKLISDASKAAAELNLTNLNYFAADFDQYNFDKEAYDVVLFNSSLHHFDKIEELLKNKILPLMKKHAYLVIYEYVGPTRLQWTKEQLDFSNTLLQGLPTKYKMRRNSTQLKKKIYRPGILRMLAIDPSEAVDSASILPSIHKLFKTVEEKQLGWNITHLLFKDIAHNFLNNDEETESLLAKVFEQEDQFVKRVNSSDAVFGIYQKE